MSEENPITRGRPGRGVSTDPRDYPGLLPPPPERPNVQLVRWALERTEGLHRCRHLRPPPTIRPQVSGTLVCETCMARGATWHGLRRCRACGHVGCCEKSRNRHAERHFWTTGHPMVDTLGPERVWSFCFVDQIRIFVSRP